MSRYAAEEFSSEKADVLRRYFANLDRPVFALVNLPRGGEGSALRPLLALDKSLRRLFLDEFVTELDLTGDRRSTPPSASNVPRSSTRRSSVEYGDDRWRSSAGCTWRASRPRTCSPRCSSGVGSCPTSSSPPATSPTTADSMAATAASVTCGCGPPRWAPATWGDLDRLLRHLRRAVPLMQEVLPLGGPPRSRATPTSSTARPRGPGAFDAVRGVLPGAPLSNVGIYGTGQGYEQLLLRMRAHPLPEARSYADLMLTELRKVDPVVPRGGSTFPSVDKPGATTSRPVTTTWPRSPDGSSPTTWRPMKHLR